MRLGLFRGLALVWLLLLFSLMIPTWGYMGAAYAMIICYSLLTAMTYVVGAKYYHIHHKMDILVHAAVYMGALWPPWGGREIFRHVFRNSWLHPGDRGEAMPWSRFLPVSWVEPNLP
ncbi:MAG: polysaccharide biosynthesis C-terminal domain-containing protein [Bacteroidia bacterium]